MAENPASWGEAEKVVSKALDEAAEAFLQHTCGLSTVRRITDALREAGLLTEERPAPHPGGGAHVCSCGRRVQ